MKEEINHMIIQCYVYFKKQSYKMKDLPSLINIVKSFLKRLR